MIKAQYIPKNFDFRKVVCWHNSPRLHNRWLATAINIKSCSLVDIVFIFLFYFLGRIQKKERKKIKTYKNCFNFLITQIRSGKLVKYWYCAKVLLAAWGKNLWSFDASNYYPSLWPLFYILFFIFIYIFSNPSIAALRLIFGGVYAYCNPQRHFI